MRLWLFAVGTIALLAQVVLLRECEVAFFGSELVLVLGLGAWLLGSAAGAASGRGAQPPGERGVRRLFVALGLLLPLAVVFARGVRILFGGVPGAYLPFGRQLLALALCLVPVAFLLGLLFQWAARRFIATGRSPAAAYALESAGGLLGGLLATLLPAAGLQNWDTALLCGVVAFAAAWPGSRVAGRGSAAAAGLFLALALLVAAVYAATDEFHQSFVPGRTASVYDVLIDTSGACAAAYSSMVLPWARGLPHWKCRLILK